MITIFCDFRQFLLKNLAFFFLKNLCCDNFFNNLALFGVKNAKFLRQVFTPSFYAKFLRQVFTPSFYAKFLR
jgi:hypothetical protein